MEDQSHHNYWIVESELNTMRKRSRNVLQGDDKWRVSHDWDRKYSLESSGREVEGTIVGRYTVRRV